MLILKDEQYFYIKTSSVLISPGTFQLYLSDSFLHTLILAVPSCLAAWCLFYVFCIWFQREKWVVILFTGQCHHFFPFWKYLSLLISCFLTFFLLVLLLSWFLAFLFLLFFLSLFLLFIYFNLLAREMLVVSIQSTLFVSFNNWQIFSLWQFSQCIVMIVIFLLFCFLLISLFLLFIFSYGTVVNLIS